MIKSILVLFSALLFLSFGNTISPEEKIKIERKITPINPAAGEYLVELEFTTNGNLSPANFTDVLPRGFRAEPVEEHGAIFSYYNNTAVFNWEMLPDVPMFKISYRAFSGIPGKTPTITGTLIYDVIDPVIPEEKTAEKAPSDNINTNPEPVASDSRITESNKNSLAEDKSVNIQYTPATTAGKGITFKIQILATSKSPSRNNSWFDSKYNLNSPVELTYDQGWKKYVVGNFQGYKEATAYRIKTQEKVSGAFVVAYMNGSRIPVSKALSINSVNQ
jgi:hypothetical protein